MYRFVALLAIYLFSFGAPAHASERVGLHLVLALDSSDSVKPERWRAQTAGYAAAFRSPELLEAIATNPGGTIAVTVVVWSGALEQVQIIPWTVIRDSASALAFATLVGETPPLYKGYTNIGSAIAFSTKILLRQTAFSRKVIDVSGDGKHRESAYTNVVKGVPLASARAEAVAAGITINGLPIEGDEYEIAKYFQEEVIGGNGSFVETVTNPDDHHAFARAIQRKLLREIHMSAR